MTANLSRNQQSTSKAHIKVTGSKSESNRLLILQALHPTISIENISNSDDTKTLQNALKIENGNVDIHHAGTAMRFLTAYYASLEGAQVVLTGSERMQERPIKILVDALLQLGAQIEYVNKQGFPPLKITGKNFTKSKVEIEANVSSQYISALMLIGSKLPNGLEIQLKGKITSLPYIKMTLQLLQKVGVDAGFSENIISIPFKLKTEEKKIAVESDWSSASYFYSIVALNKNLSVTLSNYFEESLQGDAALVEIYKELGVGTNFNATENSITLSNTSKKLPNKIEFDLNNTPDIAQTIAVTCFGLKMECHLTGLHTLKIKETDRLQALKTELEKLGANISITDNSLSLETTSAIKSNITIDTYQDHRMAMAFAPLALLVPISINNYNVVSKSYPDFWEDLEKIGINFKI